MRFARAGLAFFALITGSCGLPALPEPPAAEPIGVAEPTLAAEWEELVARPDGVPDGCFSEHLGDAILLNDARQPKYSAWSRRRSEPISERLIRAERTSLAVARWIDRRARRFQEAGIPIVCAEFVSMTLTPPLPPAPLARPAAEFDDAMDAAAIRNRIIAVYGERGFAGIAAEAEAELDRLAATPEYHCMTRHLIESLWRVAVLAPLHERLAGERDVGSTRGLSELLVRLHLAALAGGADLDRAAAPLQARGIPIICRDVPPIR
ncbi:MAG TPA: hypothetical protein VMN78_06270 [Longimicrobiales bacterium]|nr:hypothetical protein [Longimicrobiales bacterium]